MRHRRNTFPAAHVLDRRIVHVREWMPIRIFCRSSAILLCGTQAVNRCWRSRCARRGGDRCRSAINAYDAGGFTDSQVELLQTFAEQAVIAISSAETYRELQERTAALAARNSEYGERIEQQAATIDVLKVMSASPGDAQPVFELIVERARAFCEADHATTALVLDDMLHMQAYSGSASTGADMRRRFPRPVDTSTMFGRAILSRDVVQTGDIQADPRSLRKRQMQQCGFSFHRWSAAAARRHTDRRNRARTTSDRAASPTARSRCCRPSPNRR